MPKVKLQSNNNEKRMLAFLHADSEGEVDEILESSGYATDTTAWLPLGKNENNWGIVGNQQGSPVAALTETLVNCVDHILILEARLNGIDPEDSKAPRTMLEAAEKFFKIRDGQLQNITPSERTRLAERIQLIATGERKKPCYTIIDMGEGQLPEDFHDTFCGLNRQNKFKIPFVQGKFHMGSTGVLPFCGTNNYKLIISRRHPKLVSPQGSSSWGFTLIRRRPPEGNRRSSMYEYLAPGGKVLTSKLDSIPALPGDYPTAYNEPLEWGTAVKLYEYTLDRKALATVAILDLYYELNRRLQQVPFPIRICERRPDYRANSYEGTLAGMSVRLSDNRAEVLEDPQTFPATGAFNVRGVGEIPLKIYAFKKMVRGDDRWVSAREAIFLVINGQTHGAISQDFFRRSSVRLDYIAKDLMVVLDCTNIDSRVREDLFMTSRDRLRSIPEKHLLESALEEFLAKHEGLRALNHRRMEDEIRSRVEDDKPLEELLQRLIRQSPTLSALFIPGARIHNPFRRGTIEEKYEGVKFPTFFKLENDSPTGFVKSCPINKTARVVFETDAVNDYFDRDSDPGSFKLLPSGVMKSRNLWNGKATLIVQPPEKCKEGDKILVRTAVMDTSRFEPFVSEFTLAIGPAEERGKREPGPKQPPQTQRLALPKIFRVYKDNWDEYEFDELSGLLFRQSDEVGKLVAYVNCDNKWLLLEKVRSKPEERELLEKQYIWGLSLISMAIWHDHCEQKKKHASNDKKNGNGAEMKENAQILDEIRDVSRGIAMVILPAINSLAELSEVAEEPEIEEVGIF